MNPSRPVALITMADSYVGPALAAKMAGAGFDLALHTPQSHERPRIRSAHGVEWFSGQDLASRAGCDALVADVLARFGSIDAACFVTGAIVVGSFLDMSDGQWERVKRGNLDEVFHALQAIVPPMIAAGRGQVVVFTSATGARPEPKTSVYAATRAGANALVRAVGLEVAGQGVCVNAIGTNFMDFPGFLKASGAADDPARRAKIEAQVPLRRLGTMEELAEFTAVLLDGRSRFQTGQFFSFSGGWST